MTRRAPAAAPLRTVSTLLAAAILAVGCDGDSAVEPTVSLPPDPSSEGVESPGVMPEGFTTVQARITAVDGEVCEVCLWLADDGAERARGLMEVTDLGDAAGMIFSYDEPSAGSFYMFQTPTPLSIAWFAPDGRYIASTDMEPCPDARAGDCPVYSPGAEYTIAIEVFAGGLEGLGIGSGSSVELIEDSEADRCADASPSL